MSWTAGELAEQSGGRVIGDAARVARGFSTDTRSLVPGTLFVAIEGENFDGHDFVAEALAAGAAGALVSRDVPDAGSATLIRVADTLAALGRIAAHHREGFDGPVVAITGSNGKTTTKEMCAAILSATGVRVRRSAGNLNNHIGLPLSVLTLEEDDRALVVELGMNHAGEIDALARIAQPTVGAVTNIAPAHLGPLGSIEAIASAKGELFERIRPGGTAIVNADDERCTAEAARFDGRHLRFGRGAGVDLRIAEEQPAGEGERFALELDGARRAIALGALGAHIVDDAACAAAAAFATGLLGDAPLEPIARALEGFAGLPGRLELRDAEGVALLDDSYNANPRSVEAALQTLARLARGGRAIAVLGDMLELGDAEQSLHAAAGRAVAEAGVAVLVAVGRLSHHTAGAAAAGGVETHELPDSEAAAAVTPQLLRAGDTVLVKGSRGMHMERVVDALTGAG